MENKKYGITSSAAAGPRSDVTDEGHAKHTLLNARKNTSAGSTTPPSASVAANVQADNESTPPAGSGIYFDSDTPPLLGSKNSVVDKKKF